MPKVNKKALLELDEVRRAMAIAAATGPLEGALFAWMYEFGARAAEPGLQRLADIDLRSDRARPVHLKSGAKITYGEGALLPFCRAALPAYLQVHAQFEVHKDQAKWLFPARTPGRCLTCKGTGRRPSMYDSHAAEAPCHHCAGAGKRWGASRHDVYKTIVDILTRAGVPEGHRHPHTLRHSIITHLIEGGTPPTVIQDRVGHASLSTTLKYARATRAAAAKMEGSLGALYNPEVR